MCAQLRAQPGGEHFRENHLNEANRSEFSFGLELVKVIEPGNFRDAKAFNQHKSNVKM